MAGESQVEHEVAQPRGILVRQAGAERFRFPAPDDLVVTGPGDGPWRAQRVGMEVVEVRGDRLASCWFDNSTDMPSLASSYKSVRLIAFMFSHCTNHAALIRQGDSVAVPRLLNKTVLKFPFQGYRQ